MKQERYFLARDSFGESAYLFCAWITDPNFGVRVDNSKVLCKGPIQRHSLRIAVQLESEVGKINAPSAKCEEITESQFESYREIIKLSVIPVEYTGPTATLTIG